MAMWRFALSLLAAGVAFGQPFFTQTGNAAFQAGQGPGYAVARDFNGDGNLDLAFADFGNGPPVTVLLGDGRGNFTPNPGAFACGGAEPAGLLAADFNGDGIVDLAVESSLAGPGAQGGSIEICLGDGQGGFHPAPGAGPGRIILTGGTAGSMATGDFNGDGIPDLVVSNENGLIILSGDGMGGFQRGPSPSGRGAQTGAVAVADFVGNGHSDIVVVNTQGLTVFVCDGKGGFTALPIQALPGIPNAASMALADFNHDGFADLVVATGDDLHPSVGILLGDGKGGFTVKTTLAYGANSSTQPFATADFNGDGKVDLAIVDGTHATVLLGLGDGTFSQQAAFQVARQTGYPAGGVAGDFNGDGKPDYLLADGRVWLNTLPAVSLSARDAEFMAATQPVALAITPSSGVSAVSNQPWLTYSNGLVTANPNGLSAGVYRGTIRFAGAGLFGSSFTATLTVTAPSGTLIPTTGSPGAIPSGYVQYRAGDFNGDGKPDLLLVSTTNLTVWFGDGAGNFTPSGKVFPLTSLHYPAVADFNLDGNLDVALVPQLIPNVSDAVQMLLGDGTGGFTTGPVTAIPPFIYVPGGPSPQVADFNNDGIPDLSVATAIFLGDGRGGFATQGFHNVENIHGTNAPAEVAQAVVADFNRDGNPDLAFTGLGNPYLYVFLGDGKGGLSGEQFTPASQTAIFNDLVTGDWNGDGIPDVGMAVAGTGDILLLFGGPFGIPASGKYIHGPSTVSSIVPGDFNGDGAEDLAVSTADGSITIYLGDGKGAFTPSPGGTFPFGLVQLAADFNGDGRTDSLSTMAGGLLIALGGSATANLTLSQVPPSPFDIGQTISLTAKISTGAGAFGPLTGQITLSDGATVVGTAPAALGQAYFVTPYVAREHDFTAAYSGDPRNAAMSAGLKIVETGPPAAIQALGNGFPLRALVTDLNNNPVPGVRVTFSAPASGAGGTFAGSAAAAVLTDAQGIATAPVFVPNGIPGAYVITATTTIGGFVCVFAESN